MGYTMELNNLAKSESHVQNNIRPVSKVVEVFSAISKGKDLSKFDKAVADKSVQYIENLAQRASSGDLVALSEINEIRKFVIEPELLQEINLLSVFGTYEQLGYNESAEVEIKEYIPRGVKEQAFGEDVGFGTIRKRKVTVPTTNISAGHAVNYKKMQIGDMSDEYTLQEDIKVQMRNKAAKYVVETVYNAIKNATGVKYFFEAAGLTETGVNDVLAKIRRFGKPSIVGTYPLLAQFNTWAGYSGNVSGQTITGISQNVLDQINQTGLLGVYNGAILQEIPNAYDLTTIVDDDFASLIPEGLGFIIPTGSASPVHTLTRGGITSFTGNDVTTGEVITRYDLEIGTVVAPGQEYKLALIHDQNLDDLGDE